MITTDGLENASREFAYEKVKELIKHQQGKYNWEFKISKPFFFTASHLPYPRTVAFYHSHGFYFCL
ncbi:MAG: hypothetical protein RQM92_11985 [Candidatus Syntrophopropionicum ammoniitolerans]